MWDPPLTAYVIVSSIYYRLIVIDRSVNTVIINTTTTDTNYSLEKTAFCVNYIAAVIPLTPNHTGDKASTVIKTFGGEWLQVHRNFLYTVHGVENRICQTRAYVIVRQIAVVLLVLWFCFVQSCAYTTSDTVAN